MVNLSDPGSFLFVPADRPERFEKAAVSGADAVILDLEDAVAPDRKDMARAALRSDFCDLPILVRVNAADTPWHADDLTAIKQHDFAAVIIPKADDPAAIATIRRELGAKIPILPLIESARGLSRAREIAGLEGVARLVFGSIDFCADLGCAHEVEVLLPARFELVLASRLAGIAPPVDGVTAQFDDLSLTRADTLHARALGMTGKLCIHPRQVEAVRKGFAPSDAEIDWALRVLASGDGVASIDGAMIDAPVRMRAKTILGRIKAGPMP